MRDSNSAQQGCQAESLKLYPNNLVIHRQSMQPKQITIAANKIISAIPRNIELRLTEIGPTIAPAQTSALYSPLHATEPYSGINVVRDMNYGPHERNLLDLFTADESSGPAPVLVFIHGGGFTAGSKKSPSSPFYDNVMLWAATHGMIGVNATYRLAPAHQWPSAQQDLGMVIQWVKRNIGKYGGDADRVFLLGHSAGAAHVAQYLGHSEFHTVPNGGVIAAMLISGIFDLASFAEKAMAESYFGGDPVVMAERCALPGLANAHLPLLFAYAEHDPATFKEQTTKAVERLCQANSKIELAELVGHNHLSEVYGINTNDQGLSNTLLAFMKENRR